MAERHLVGEVPTIVADGIGTSPSPVHVGAVVNAFDANQARIVINSIDNAVAAPTGGVSSGEFEVQGPADTMWVVRQGGVDELGDGASDLLGQPPQVTQCRR
jgi:hypothetical protein